METRNDFVRALGIVPGIRAPARLNFAGWAELEPRRYGRMEFRFADRAVPGPFERDRDPPVSHPAPLDYVARAIEEARKSGRVLVQCTSYTLVGELAVLPTPAAWSGVSLPGLVDHGRHSGVLFRPHAVRDRGHAELPRAVGIAAGCRGAPRCRRPDRRGAPQARSGDWPRDPGTARELHRVAPRSAISAAKVDGPGDRGSRSGEGGEAPATHQLHSPPVPQWPPARDRSGSSLAGCASRPLIVGRRSGAPARAWPSDLVIRARRQVHGAPRGADRLLARVHSAQGRAAEEGGTIGFAAPGILANATFSVAATTPRPTPAPCTRWRFPPAFAIDGRGAAAGALRGLRDNGLQSIA